MITSAFVTESIGIHAFFGAFLAGVIVPKKGPFVMQVCVTQWQWVPFAVRRRSMYAPHAAPRASLQRSMVSFLSQTRV
jgi:hypothetical protein